MPLPALSESDQEIASTLAQDVLTKANVGVGTVDIAPAVASYSASAKTGVETTLKLLAARVEHLENVLRSVANAIQPAPGERLPPVDPLKTPDPAGQVTPENAALVGQK